MRQRSKRSYGGWTCSDLAIILREYDFVITLLERINDFIRNSILDKLGDQADAEIKNFVTKTLATYTEAEEEVRAQQAPFLQIQTSLGCLAQSFIEEEKASAKNETDAKIEDLQAQLGETEHGPLHGALTGLIDTLMNLSN